MGNLFSGGDAYFEPTFYPVLYVLYLILTPSSGVG
jgi:hypothetical protein